MLRRLCLLAFLLFASSSCHRAVYSPPARLLLLESAATLPRGDTGIQLEGSVHETIFGPDALAGTMRVRHGIESDLDLSVEASATRIVTNEAPAAPISRSVYSVRGGLKYRLTKKWLAMAGGVGAGHSAGGPFVSPDFGPIIAWENKYCVPFLTLRGGVSQPLGARPVDISAASEPLGSFVDTPRTTFIVTAAHGVRVPIGWSEPEAGRIRGSILAGVGIVHLADARDDETFFGTSIGGEIVF